MSLPSDGNKLKLNVSPGKKKKKNLQNAKDLEMCGTTKIKIMEVGGVRTLTPNLKVNTCFYSQIEKGGRRDRQGERTT